MGRCGLPESHAEHALTKMMLHEIPELLQGGVNDPLEFADVAILFVRYRSLKGIDIGKAISDKMGDQQKTCLGDRPPHWFDVALESTKTNSRPLSPRADARSGPKRRKKLHPRQSAVVAANPQNGQPRPKSAAVWPSTPWGSFGINCRTTAVAF